MSFTVEGPCLCEGCGKTYGCDDMGHPLTETPYTCDEESCRQYVMSKAETLAWRKL